MNRLIIFLFLMFLGITLVHASPYSNIMKEFSLDSIGCELILPFKSEIIGQEIPNQIPYSNEIFGIYISGDFFGTIEIEESKVIDFNCIENENKTYEIMIEDYQTILDFTDSDDPIGMLNEKLSSEEIEIKGVTVGKKIKIFFTRIGLKIAKWFI